jgi:hypothetical protein
MRNSLIILSLLFITSCTTQYRYNKQKPQPKYGYAIIIRTMKPTVTLPKERYSLKKLENDLKTLQESGHCSVKDPKFYNLWDMVEFGTDKYETKFSQKKPN